MFMSNILFLLSNLTINQAHLCDQSAADLLQKTEIM